MTTLRSLTQPATSLGGVESLIEHRMGSDPDTDHRLVRLSIGMEEVEVCISVAICVEFGSLTHVINTIGFEGRS